MSITRHDISLEVNGKALEGWITLSGIDTGPSGEYTETKKSLKELLVPGRDFVFCHQVHSLRVLFLDSDPRGVRIFAYRGRWVGERLEIEQEKEVPDWVGMAEISGVIGEADGIISRVRTSVPGATVADCIPIYLHQKPKSPSAVLNSPIYGTLHSGWQGTGILMVAFRGIKDLWGLGPEEFEVGFGPGICGDCYVVDSLRADILRTRFGNQWIHEVPGTGEWAGHIQYALDLFGMNRDIARNIGVELVRAEIHCTKEQEKYWSYRRGQSSQRMFAFTLGKDST